MSVDDWNIPNYILDGEPCSHDYLNHYKYCIDLLNGTFKCCAVSTRKNRKEQVDALKKALGLNHKRDDKDLHDNNDFISNPHSRSPSFSNTQTKGLPDK